MLLNLLDDMFFAAIPAVGFAILFNVPRNALKYCAYLGALGHGSRTLMMQFGAGPGHAVCGFAGGLYRRVFVATLPGAPESVYRGRYHPDDSGRVCV